MGSPYMSFEVSKVNVIRSEGGLLRLISELGRITHLPMTHRRALLLVVYGKAAYSYDKSGSDLSDLIYPVVGLDEADVDKCWAVLDFGEEASEESYNKLHSIVTSPDISKRSNFHTFATPMTNLIACFIRAQVARRRTTMVFATRYEFSETKLLDRCVVLDMTTDTRI